MHAKRSTAILGTAAVAFLGAVWALDAALAATASGQLNFVAKNGVSTANGTFHRWQVAEANVDARDLTRGSVVVTVDLASVDTGIEDRDEHLRTADFFDVARFPTATARLHGAAPAGTSARGSEYTVKVDLDLHGVEKTLDGRFTVVGEDPLSIVGTVSLDRLDFGIGTPDQWWNPLAIRDVVEVSFAASLTE